VARVSIIVPVYDVEPYLAASLESLAAQTWKDLEVIVVDDGSPDGSARIAERYAARDRRFQLIRQANAGLGASRNAGISRARGEFLAFVDSDDLLPLDAVETMVRTLDESGSDLVTGNVARFTNRSTYSSPMHRAIFAEPAVGTHVTRQEILLKDRLVTNKLWRRAFWDDNGLAFPEGVLYEDTAVALRGHFLARAVDVVHTPVYLWREREGGKLSITQDRAQVKGIEDRIASVDAVRAFLEGSGRAEHLRAWDRMVLESDLTAFFPAVEAGDEAFNRRFAELGAAYLDRAGPEALAGVSVLRRLKWHLLRHGDFDGLVEVMEWERDAKLQAVRQGTRFVLTGCPADLPAEVLRLSTDDLALQQRVDTIAWEDGKLRVEARATLRYLQPDHKLHQLVFARLVHQETGRRVHVPVKKVLAEPFVKSKRLTWGGLRMTIDPARLLGEKPGTWDLELTVIHRGMVRKERLSGATEKLVTDAGPVLPAPGMRVTPRKSPGGRLSLTVEREPAVITRWAAADGVLTVTGVVDGGRAVRVRAVHGVREAEARVRADGDTFHADITLADLARRPLHGLEITGIEARVLDAPVVWPLTVNDAHVHVAEDSPQVRHLAGEREFVVGPAPDGRLVIRELAPVAVVAQATWLEGELLLRGSLPHPIDGPVELAVWARTQGGEHTFPVLVDGGAFEARITLLGVRTLGGTLPLRAGGYRLTLRAPGTELRVEYSGEPLEDESGGRTLTLQRGAGHEARLSVGTGLAKDERGATKQTRLQEGFYPGCREIPLAEAVFFDSYSGKQYSDSPKAICEELRRRGTDLDLRWNVRDGQVELPDGLREVRTNSREYYRSLATCRYIVTNAHLPVWFRRREGQVVVQTWHGSTLKRIGYDIADVQFARSDYHERLDVEVPQWDYLISPSPWCSPVLTSAFRFGGRLLEVGYPRNDVLADPGLGSEVRRRLGVPEGRRVVLYAPTWRDDQFHGNGRYVFEQALDLDLLRTALGEECVLLVRRHPNISDVVRDPSGWARDVTAYPDIQELYLASDVLVTDYSSAMFDFAVTGKPMLFFTYDLEHYRDVLRGFYFDFEAEAPGPLLRTSAELLAALQSLPEVERKYEALYRDFRRRFCPLDDGHAAGRVVDQVFPQWSRSGMDIAQ
jgi:CDP-glycerol glycerophosphotransferase